MAQSIIENADEKTDWQLLRAFADHRSPAAFAALARRYTDLVYSVCRRELGDRTLAEDAAQAAFLVLARKASSLRPGRDGATLAGWLFQTARLTARNAARQERRRQAVQHSYQQEAARMHSQTPDTAAEWAEAEPLLNEALSALPASQRALILERFMQERPLAEVGAERGIYEDAARMRVNRALARLRRFFAARGVALSAAALAALLGQSVRPAPARCAESLPRLPLSQDTPTHTLAHGVIHAMNQKRLQLKLGVAALVVALPLGTLGAVRVTTQMKARTVRASKAQSQARAIEVLNQMYATYAAMNSFSCVVTDRIEPSYAQDAVYVVQRPDPFHYKFHLERTSLTGNPQWSGHSEAIDDGQFLYVASTENGAQAGRYAKLALIPPQEGRLKGGQYGKEFFYRFGGIASMGKDNGMPALLFGKRLGEEQWENMLLPEYSLGQPAVMSFPYYPSPVPVDVVICRIPYHPKTPGLGPGAAEMITYYIGQKDHLLYQTVVTDAYSPTTPDIRTETYFMKINPSLPASDFVFTLPPGSHEVSTTEDLFPKK